MLYNINIFGKTNHHMSFPQPRDFYVEADIILNYLNSFETNAGPTAEEFSSFLKSRRWKSNTESILAFLRYSGHVSEPSQPVNITTAGKTFISGDSFTNQFDDELINNAGTEETPAHEETTAVAVSSTPAPVPVKRGSDIKRKQDEEI